jgi:hypothetical protein
MEADTDVSGTGFVLDEDDLNSDDDTKVPTQQSVKAYVDGLPVLTADDPGEITITPGAGTTEIALTDEIARAIDVQTFTSSGTYT